MLVSFLSLLYSRRVYSEYVKCFWELYEPSRYLSRVYRHFKGMKPAPHKAPFRMLELVELKAVLTVFWRQGIKRDTRFQFWRQLFSIMRHNSGVFVPYLSNCALIEHFIDYRQVVREEIEGQLNEYLAGVAKFNQQVKPVTEFSPAVSERIAS